MSEPSCIPSIPKDLVGIPFTCTFIHSVFNQAEMVVLGGRLIRRWVNLSTHSITLVAGVVGPRNRTMFRLEVHLKPSTLKRVEDLLLALIVLLISAFADCGNGLILVGGGCISMMSWRSSERVG